jgi:hypothetical protein
MTTAICSTKGIQPGPSAYWRQRLAVQPSESLTKTLKYTLSFERHGLTAYLIADSNLIDDTSEWWTLNIDQAQIIYDLEVAFGKAGILSSLIDAPVEVVALD